MPFTVGYSPFYSATLGFLGYDWFLPFAPIDIRTNVVSTTLVADPFLILYYFFLLRFLLQKPLVDIPILEGSRRLTFVLSFSKASRFHLFPDPPFGRFLFCHFFLSELIPFCQTKRSPTIFLYGSSSWVPWDTRPLLMSCWFPSLLIPFLHHWVADRDSSLLVLYVSWHAPLKLS